MNRMQIYGGAKNNVQQFFFNQYMILRILLKKVVYQDITCVNRDDSQYEYG